MLVGVNPASFASKRTTKMSLSGDGGALLSEFADGAVDGAGTTGSSGVTGDGAAGLVAAVCDGGCFGGLITGAGLVVALSQSGKLLRRTNRPSIVAMSLSSGPSALMTMSVRRFAVDSSPTTAYSS
jgi:hypothetical protein